jgi:hypothetical protein
MTPVGFILTLVSGPILFATIVVIYDFIAERHNERERLRKRLLP